MPHTRHRPKTSGRKVRPVPKKSRRATAANPDLSDTLSELAQKIAFNYRNPDGSSKLQFELDVQTVSDWKRGKRLDGSPPPPARVNARQWNARQWIEWFEKYQLAKWKISNGSVAVDDIRLLKQEDEREALEFKKFDRDRQRGLFIPIAEHNRIALEFGTILNHAITEHGERELTKNILAVIESLSIPEDQKRVLVLAVKETALTSVDGLRAAIKAQVSASQAKEGE